MVFKSYFDGSNKADLNVYDYITLAALTGKKNEWMHFEADWGIILRKHGASHLHTTDALSLKDEFEKDKGWTKEKVCLFLEDCVSVLERLCAKQQGHEITKFGIRPSTVTIDLVAFQQAESAIPDLNPVNDVCATQVLKFVDSWWQFNKGLWLQLYFDQGEPFYGHIHDRLNNPRHKADHPSTAQVIHCAPTNMRFVTPLQAADLFAWAVSHANDVHSEWHRRILTISRDHHYIDKAKIFNPDLVTLEKLKKYRMPQRQRLKAKGIGKKTTRYHQEKE